MPDIFDTWNGLTWHQILQHERRTFMVQLLKVVKNVLESGDLRNLIAWLHQALKLPLLPTLHRLHVVEKWGSEFLLKSHWKLFEVTDLPTITSGSWNACCTRKKSALQGIEGNLNRKTQLDSDKHGNMLCGYEVRSFCKSAHFALLLFQFKHVLSTQTPTAERAWKSQAASWWFS